MVLSQMAKSGELSTQLLKTYLQKYLSSNKEEAAYEIKFLQGCRPLDMKIGSFHTANMEVLFLGLNVILNYAVSLLLATKDIKYQM